MDYKMLKTATSLRSGGFGWIYGAVGLTLVILYLASCFSPLRLEYDSVRYFAIKECIDPGCSPDSKAAHDFLPYGYPVLLTLLSKLGLLKSFWIALVNGLFMAGGLYLITRTIVPAGSYFIFCVMVLLNWTFIKLFAYPLSEMQYLFFSSASFYCYFRFSRDKNTWFLVLSFVSAIIAMMTRTVGIALVTALVLGFAWDNRKKFFHAGSMLRILIGVILAGVAIFLSTTKMPELSHYAGAFFKNEMENPDVGGMLSAHTKELGQLLLNTPAGKIENYLPDRVGHAIFIFAGILMFACFVFALLKLRSALPVVIVIYLILYSLIVFNWPMYDSRFWVPVLPFIVTIILRSIPFAPRIKFIFPILAGIYFAAGIFAFGYSFYTQFDKKAFSRAQANGIYRNEYETHFLEKY